jgi:hypothetical protein
MSDRESYLRLSSAGFRGFGQELTLLTVVMDAQVRAASFLTEFFRTK